MCSTTSLYRHPDRLRLKEGVWRGSKKCTALYHCKLLCSFKIHSLRSGWQQGEAMQQMEADMLPKAFISDAKDHWTDSNNINMIAHAWENPWTHTRKTLRTYKKTLEHTQETPWTHTRKTLRMHTKNLAHTQEKPCADIEKLKFSTQI